MPAVPSNQYFSMEFQDNRGFRATVRVNGFLPDISTGTVTLAQIYGAAAAVSAAVAACSNAKLVRVGTGFDFDYAQEPSSEAGTYELVMQKARLQGGDGNGGFEFLSVPAPKDALFLTTADNNLVVINPAAGGITGLQAALAANVTSPRGGGVFSQFFGGQLVEGKPRVRRVLQGA